MRGRVLSPTLTVEMPAHGNRAGLLAYAVLVPVALVVAACGSQRDSSRVQSMIEAKYGINVVGCSLDRPPGNGGGAQQWRCDLSSPRTDTIAAITSTSWCVANASPDDEFESAYLARPRSRMLPCSVTHLP